MAFKVRMKNMQDVNMKAVVRNLVLTIVMLWVGGVIIQEIGSALNGTCSPFYRGLGLIGWTVGTVSGNYSAEFTAGTDVNCFLNAAEAAANYNTTLTTGANTITGTNGTGVLTVVGLIGVASVVLQFVDFRF